MGVIETVWLLILFVVSFFAGFLAGNFFGESKAEDVRYKYLSGELK